MSTVIPTTPAPPEPDGVLDERALATLRSLDPTGSGKLLERVLAAFRSSLGRLLPQLAAAGRSADAETAKQVAHTLKSSSASVGAVRLSRLCAELEAAIRDGACGDLGGRVDAIEAEAAKILGALGQLLKSGS